MLVAQVSKAGGPFELVERPKPEPGPCQVLIKIDACVLKCDTSATFPRP